MRLKMNGSTKKSKKKKKHMETNEDEHTTVQNLWDAEKRFSGSKEKLKYIT